MSATSGIEHRPSARLPRQTARVVSAAVGLVLILVAVVYDARLSAWATRGDVVELCRAVTGFLDPLFPILIGIGVIASFYTPLRPRVRFLAGLLGFLIPLLLHLPFLHLMKWTIGRARPELALGPFRFAPLHGGKFDSFPSGHTMAAVIIALSIGWYFPRARWIVIAWAAAEAVKRLYTGWHWPSDIVAGWLIAVVIVWLCRRKLPVLYGPNLPPTTPT
jgi:membrane-associated phospholipid phosphatase